MRPPKVAIALLALLLVLALTGCQAPLSIVPSTMTPTPTGQPGRVAPAASATATTTIEATATTAVTPSPLTTTPVAPTAEAANPTPTATDTATPTVQPTHTPTVQPTDTATVRPTHTATARPTRTATVRPVRTATPALRASPTRTPTALLQSRRLTPTATRRLATATRRPPTRTPTPARLRIEMTEAQLNKSVRDAIAKDPKTPVRSISIDTKPGKVVITAQARLGFFNVNLEITVVVEVRNGKATPVIQEVKVNGGPAAGLIRQQVEAALQPYLNQIADISKDIYVESVTISESGLRIEGRPK